MIRIYTLFQVDFALFCPKSEWLKFDDHYFPPKPNPNWKENSPEFMGLKPIYFDDLKSGTSLIEHITREEFFNPKKVNGATTKTLVKGVFCFGKYRGQSVAWVRQHDPQYINWCAENIDGFDLD